MVSGLVLCCLLAVAAAAPNPLANDTVPLDSWGNQDIVNGLDSRYGLFNSILVLKLNGRFVCGASLISATRALTAAHCVQAPGKYSVVAGELDRSKTSGKEKSRSVTTIVKHPQHEVGSKNANDIAILKFDSLPTVGFIGTIQRFTSADGDPTKLECWIAGWGDTSGAEPSESNMLKYRQVKVIKNSDCQKPYTVPPELGLGDSVKIEDHQVCIENYANKVSTCSGDSGGPLECKKGLTKKLVGVSSFTAYGCSGEVPSTFTRVSSFESWINSNI